MLKKMIIMLRFKIKAVKLHTAVPRSNIVNLKVDKIEISRIVDFRDELLAGHNSVIPESINDE